MCAERQRKKGCEGCPESKQSPDSELQNVLLTQPDLGYLTMPLKLSFSAAPNIAPAVGLFLSHFSCSSRAAQLNHIAHCGFYCLPTTY